MTWTKLGDDFADQCADLTDAAFRLHVEGLVWSMRRETGGWLSDRDLRRLAEVDDPVAAAAELVAHGFWSAADQGWQIHHAMDVQIEPEVLAVRRKKNAERMAQRRRDQAGLE